MNRKQLCSLGLIVTIISFAGFWVENIWLALTRGYMNNRNMLFPFLFGYGLSVFVMYLMFGSPRHPRFFKCRLDTGRPLLNALIFFGLIFVCVSVGELLLGTFVEKVCGIVWWNYTRLPLHLGKYTSLPTSTGFALLITLFMRFLFEPLYNGFMRMNDTLLLVLASVFMSMMLFDFVYSGIRMFLVGHLWHLWRIPLPGLRIFG